jgi:urease accessory protein
MGHGALALLHLCDSLFPLGSFAHSDGLESAVHSGRLCSPSDLRGWMDVTLDVVLRQAEAPAVRDAIAAAVSRDVTVLAAIDADIDAMRPSAAGRQATRTMGTRLLKTWHHIRPSAVTQLVLDGRHQYTFPVAFGIVCAASGTGPQEAIEGYCYTRLAAIISAAMRLMPLGQHEAHGLLADVLRDVPETVVRVIVDAAQPRAYAPQMDIACMGHQYMHSRLFRS